MHQGRRRLEPEATGRPRGNRMSTMRGSFRGLAALLAVVIVPIVALATPAAADPLVVPTPTLISSTFTTGGPLLTFDVGAPPAGHAVTAIVFVTSDDGVNWGHL